MIRNLTRAAFACALLTASGASVFAQDATITVWKGAVTPDPGLSGDVEVGSRFRLTPDAEATIYHIASCEVIDVRGGAVSIMPSGVRVRGGEIISRNTKNCPSEMELVDTTSKGLAVLNRGDGDDSGDAGKVSTVGPQPRFLIRGDANFSDVSVFDDGSLVATLPVVRGRTSWPTTIAPLTAGKTYRFALQSPDGTHKGGGLSVQPDGPGLVFLGP